MLFLLIRQLRSESLRPVLTVLAISVVVAEILLLEGFRAGLYLQLREGVLNRGGDLIVTQSGISNFMGARSILPQLTRLAVEDIPGVEEAHPLTAISVIYERDGRRTPIIVVVYDTAGGPTDIISGHGITGDREIVIDEAISVKYQLFPGDPIVISEFEFTIAGVSRNSAAFLTPFAFIKYGDLIDFYLESAVVADIATFPMLSFLLVETGSASEIPKVAHLIDEQIPAADVYFPEALAIQDEGLGRQMLGPILGLLLAVSYGIGVLVVGLFMFSANRARLRSLGVLKALGFPARTMAMAAIVEATLLTLIAVPIGVGLADVTAEIIQKIAPIYLVLATEPRAIARTFVACIIFAILGGLVPVRVIARIDPASAFRG